MIEDENEIKIDSDELVKQIKEVGRVRKFSEKRISREHIKAIIEAGNNTSINKGVSCVVLQKNISVYEKEALSRVINIKNMVGNIYNGVDKIDIEENYLFKKAKLVIVIKSENKDNGSIVANNMGKKAQSLGLSVYNGNLFTLLVKSSSKLKKMLKIKSNEKIIATLVIGYPKNM